MTTGLEGAIGAPTIEMRPWSPNWLVVGWDLADESDESVVCIQCIDRDDWVLPHPTVVRWYQTGINDTCARCKDRLMVVASNWLAAQRPAL